MNNVLQFKPKDIKFLWSPNGKTSAAWRLGSKSAVLHFKRKFGTKESCSRCVDYDPTTPPNLDCRQCCSRYVQAIHTAQVRAKAVANKELKAENEMHMIRNSLSKINTLMAEIKRSNS